MAPTYEQSGGSPQEPDLYLGILTKEEKEALLTKKMEDLRRKNEALRKRHEEIEADKKAAQQMGRMVDPRTQVQVIPNRRPEVSRDHHRDRYSRNMRGVREDRREEESRPSKLAAGRGKRLSNMSKQTLQAQNFHTVSDSQAEDLDSVSDSYTEEFDRVSDCQAEEYNTGISSWAEEMSDSETPQDSAAPVNNPGSNHRRAGPIHSRGVHRSGGGGGGRHGGGSGGRRGGAQEPPTQQSENGPPPDPVFSFLSDRSRDGPLPEKFRDQRSSARHPRNFGGTDFNNVQQRVKDVSLQDRRRSPARSKMEMAMRMTGQERQQYSQWKTERDTVDQARIDRQLSNAGDWKRAWDHDKIEQDSLRKNGYNSKS